MTNKRGQAMMQIAIATIGMGVVLMVGFMIIESIKIELGQNSSNSTIINNNNNNISVIDDYVVSYNTTNINYSNYGKKINENFDDLYNFDIDLGLEDI